jgi:rhodanese-related sulfurtransferase
MSKTIVDVHTPAELMGEHVAGSIHLSLQEIPNRLQEFKNPAQTIILYCTSGNRSGQAGAYLKANGIVHQLMNPLSVNA